MGKGQSPSQLYNKMKWKCKICKNEYKENAKKCYYCNIPRQELKNIWICKQETKGGSRCLNALHIDTPKCNLCGARRKRKITDQELISRTELLMFINKVNDPMHKAFISLLYLTGCRVSELLYNIRKKDIEMQELEEGTPFLYINNLTVLKRRKKISRNVPINMKREKGFINNILEYLVFKKDNDILFPFTRSNAQKIIYNKMGKEFFPHYFRHLRATHLVTPPYNFNTMQLKQFFAWANSSSGDSYAHLNVVDLANQMK